MPCGHFWRFLRRSTCFLLNPFHLEVEYQVKPSIFDIRTECTQAIGRLSDNSARHCPYSKGIRAACRRLHSMNPFVTGRHFHQRDFRWPESPEFFTALGEFRATVGALVANSPYSANLIWRRNLLLDYPRRRRRRIASVVQATGFANLCSPLARAISAGIRRAKTHRA